jgi:hypothetical protein
MQVYASETGREFFNLVKNRLSLHFFTFAQILSAYERYKRKTLDI